MTDHATPMFDDMDDLELITSYLNGHLPPDRAEAVRRRLEEDAAFLDFAAPVILTWQAYREPAHEPLPEGDWERAWEEFVRRSGFPNRPVPGPRRRRWVFALLSLLILAALVTVHIQRAPIRAYLERRDYGRPLPYDTAWVTLGDGIAVRLGPGASVRRREAPLSGRQLVLLDGTARFVVRARDSADRAAAPGRFRVRTRAGDVTAAEADFTVTTRPDTTLVTVHPFRAAPSRPPSLAFPIAPRWVDITTQTGPDTASIILREGQRGRMVRDRVPEILAGRP